MTGTERLIDNIGYIHTIAVARHYQAARFKRLQCIAQDRSRRVELFLASSASTGLLSKACCTPSMVRLPLYRTIP